MPAFFVEPTDVAGDSLALVGEEARHVRVRRCREGECIDAIDGRGMGYHVRIESMSADRVEGTIVARRPEWGESAVRLHLAAAVPKGARFDVVVEKGTEVGVAAIVPMLTERGVAKPDGRRTDRWERLARAAAKQCDRSRVPDITAPVSLPVAAAKLAETCPRLLVAGAADGPELMSALPQGTGPVALFIGPEGGFDPVEWRALLELGARSFTWGERVLRAETAAVVLSALAIDVAASKGC